MAYSDYKDTLLNIEAFTKATIYINSWIVYIILFKYIAFSTEANKSFVYYVIAYTACVSFQARTPQH